MIRNLTIHASLTVIVLTWASVSLAADPPAALPADFTKNRYISFIPNNGSEPVAFEVALPDGRIGWIGEPELQHDRDYDHHWVALVEPSAAGDGSDQVRDWSIYTKPSTGENTIHVTGCVIIPDEIYPVRSRDASGVFSATVDFPTTPPPSNAPWGDLPNWQGASFGWEAPDGLMSLDELATVIDTFLRSPDDHSVSWADLAGATPDYRMTIADVSMGIDAFSQVAYFDLQPCCDSIADCSLGYVPPPSGFQGGAIEFVPRSATGGNPTIVGNEIQLTNGGVEVTVELRVSNWDPDLDGSPRLKAVQATVDPISFLGSNATPPDVGVDLVPVGWPDDPHLGAYQTTGLCFGGALDGEPCGTSHNSPHNTADDCLAAGGQFFCVNNPDLVLVAEDPVALVARVSQAIEWGVSQGVIVNDGGIDDGDSNHLGELRLSVPVGASGTYTINFDNAANATFMIADGQVPITGLALTPAFITIGSGAPEDCQPNGTPDFEDIANGTSANCNLNGTPDECDIAGGFSEDCNGNGVPDECELAEGTSEDCNGNGVPDECDDCNNNGTADVDDIGAGTSTDCDANCVPDECDPDCNSNDIPDACDISSGTSVDSNDDSVPDECFSPVLTPDGRQGETKNRYISFVPNNGQAVVAISVDLPDGRQGWVGTPVEKTDRGIEPAMVSVVVDAPVFKIWDEEIVHVTGCVIIPDEQYEVRAVIEPATFSDPLSVPTTPNPGVGTWADVSGTFDSIEGHWNGPNNWTNFGDIATVIDGFQQKLTAPVIWTDLAPQWPDYVINFADISATIKGFQEVSYFESLAGFDSLDECPLGDEP